VIAATLGIAGAIMAEAALSFLGLGVQPPTPSWGELLGQAQQYFSIAGWLVIYPSLALFITLLCLILIGMAIRDAYDSRAA
jgi:ABC-type dipeptide/oligopeptide/nickel transport system permease subunit